jgi:hypothetical protein
MVVLFRLVPFPLASFRQGYDFSFIPTQTLRWIAVCLAIGRHLRRGPDFRGTCRGRSRCGMVRLWRFWFLPSFFALHLTKGWATIGMVPDRLGAGVLLGMLAWASCRWCSA